MCELLRRQRLDGTSLGAFRPREVLDLEITDTEPWSEGQKNRLAQLSLLADDRKELEWIPYRFRYHYLCSDDACNGHKQSIIDWEIKQAWREWHVKYAETWRDRIREKWLDEICSPAKDTAFFVGNQFSNPRGFLVLGTWWPPKQPAEQLGLL